MTYFIDTNVLVYARDAVSPKKQQRAHSWLERLWTHRTGRLSYQVLHEYYVTVTQKLSPGLEVSDARDDVRAFEAWNPIVIGKTVMEGAWNVQDRFSFSWWDALIVSSAQILDCRYLLTEDLQHEQVLDGVTVLNPFKTTSLPDS